MKESLSIRYEPRPEDMAFIGQITESTGFFRPDEAEVAVSLARERLEKGEESGYHFCFAENRQGEVLGYACFGPIPCTLTSFDLYWIAVRQDRQGSGIGRILISEVEQAVERMGGMRIYIETSARAQYESTRRFYLSCGYTEAALLEDFYAPGDSKVIFLKVVAGPSTDRMLD